MKSDRRTSDYLDHYREYGYAVVRGVFSTGEIEELAEAFDRVYAQGMALGASFRFQNTLYRVTEDPQLGRIVRMVQWPSYFDRVLDRFRRDPRMYKILAPLLGPDMKQIINQMHWKPPGAEMAEFGYHQDIRFRRPRRAYRKPVSSYVQTGIAVDRHNRDSGAMTVFPGSHRMGELIIADKGSVMETPVSDVAAARSGLDTAAKLDLELEPGDVALWNLFTVHGSGPNRSEWDRRFYLNGYVRAEDCDRGEWAFRDGAPCTLGEPVLVHYEELHSRPEPHFVASR